MIGIILVNMQIDHPPIRNYNSPIDSGTLALRQTGLGGWLNPTFRRLYLLYTSRFVVNNAKGWRKKIQLCRYQITLSRPSFLANGIHKCKLATVIYSASFEMWSRRCSAGIQTGTWRRSYNPL